MLSFNLVLIALPVTYALVLQKPREPGAYDHSHNIVPTSLHSQTWYHPEDHPVHALFRRATDDSADNITYAPVGSPGKSVWDKYFNRVLTTRTEWSSGFPSAGLAVPDPSILPQAWVNALNSAVADGKIPNLTVSYQTAPNTNPTYPNGLDPTGSEVCSATYGCRIPGDIWDSPDGVFASSFDDGPTPVSWFSSFFRSCPHA